MLDVLGCDRIDHGYVVMENHAVISRLREDQTPFTGIFTRSRRCRWPCLRAYTKAMIDAGPNLIRASDNPGMFPPP
ncbi:hypothetical protein [Arthrobacter sp. ZGTC212]|uniref:hypothetical protein n=1 Tax=Arthrobacter sp. ZGTC212 TaxID=2058899 RepID=UPI000CE3EE89|nr:hypothetical protein [Arthrobacter sp. ZGTC212]